MNIQFGKLSCAGVGVALLVTACAGKSLKDVGDVGGNHEDGGGNHEGGGSDVDLGGGRGGVYPVGGAGMAGKPSGHAGEGGTGGTLPVFEAGAGGTGGVTNPCDDARIVPIFDFAYSAVVVNTSGRNYSERWVKDPYDSTDTSTGKVNNTNNPPGNPQNLANMSTLDIDFDSGNVKPAMRYVIPFSPWPLGPQEWVNLVYIFANLGEPENAVDLSQATLTADARLAQAPNENCTVTINAWTTGTDAATGTSFNHIDGPQVQISQGSWVTVPMDLSKSSPAATVNQLGFVLKSKCTDPHDGVGGAGVGGAGGATGSGDIEPTIVLIDNIRMSCD